MFSEKGPEEEEKEEMRIGKRPRYCVGGNH